MSHARKEARNFIQEQNSKHKVVVWSKTYCPYCAATKQVLQSMNIGDDMVIHEIDTHPQGRLLQEQLRQLTGQRTVPNVFINNQHIGGNDKVQELSASGKLDALQASDVPQ